MSDFNAKFYPPNSAESEPVVVRIADDRLVFINDHAEREVPFDQLALSLGGHEGKRLVLADTRGGGTVVCADLKLLDALQKESHAASLTPQIQQVRKNIADLPKREGKTWAIFLAIIAVLGIAIYSGVDMMTGFIIRQIPPSAEKSLGDIVLSGYRDKHKLEEKGPDFDRVRRIVSRLTKQLPDNKYDFKVYVEQSSDVNAFAMPGGNVVVLSGLLRKASDNNEVAGVLGHEIGHVVHRHTLKSALHKIGLLGCFKLVFQGVGVDQLEWLGGLIDLDSLRFGREQENEADTTGVKLMHQADYDPNGLVHFFQKLEKTEDSAANLKMLEILSTHPCTPERIAHIKKQIEQLPTGTRGK